MKNENLSDLIKKFNAWHRLVRSLSLVQQVAFASACLLLVYCVADKLVYFDLDLEFAALVVGMVALFVLLIAFIGMRRMTPFVGYLVDRNAGLKNLVASALEVEGHNDPVAQAVVVRARDELLRHNPREIMKPQFNRYGKFLAIPLVLLMGISAFVQPLDVFGRKKERDAKNDALAKRKKSAKLISETLKQLKKVDQKITSIEGKNITDDMNALAHGLENSLDRKEALSKLNSLENKYKKEFNQQRDFEKATRNLAARLDAHDLNPLSRKMLKNLAESLRKNDFQSAAKAMRQLAQQMMGDELSDRQKDAMARELNKIVSQMQGQDKADKLAETLKKMQRSAAKQKQQISANNQQKPPPKKNPGQKNPNQMAKNQKPKQQQNKQQMGQNRPKQQQNQQTAKQQANTQKQQSNGSCNKPGSKPGNQQASKPGGQGQPGAQSQGQKQAQQATASDQMANLADEFDQMQALKQMQKGLKNAREGMVGKGFEGFDAKDVDKFLAKPGEGDGQCPGGKKPGQGVGMKGPGQGRGGIAQERMGKTSFKDEVSPSKQGKGKILNQIWVYGIPEKGEARKEYSAEVRNAKEDAMSSLARNPVPKEYEDMVKSYFSSLDSKEE